MRYTMTIEQREAFLAEPHVAILAVATEQGVRGPVQMPVWYAYHPGGDILIPTAASSQKVGLIQRTWRASLCVQRDGPPYAYVSVEGPALITPDSGPELRAGIAARYLNEQLTAKYLDSTSATAMVTIRLSPEQWRTADFTAQLDGLHTARADS